MSENKNSTSNRFLQFNLGTECYAIPLLQVREVIGVPETTPIPYAPAYFIGLMNLRGQVISILDLRQKLGIKPSESRAEQAVVILDLGGIILGCVVDSINRVLNVGPDQIQPAIDVEGGVKMDFLLGVTQTQDKLTAILDVFKLMNVTDLNAIKAKAA